MIDLGGKFLLYDYIATSTFRKILMKRVIWSPDLRLIFGGWSLQISSLLLKDIDDTP